MCFIPWSGMYSNSISFPHVHRIPPLSYFYQSYFYFCSLITLLLSQKHTHISLTTILCLQCSKLYLLKLAIFVLLIRPTNHTAASALGFISIYRMLSYSFRSGRGMRGKVRLRCIRKNLKLFN